MTLAKEQSRDMWGIRLMDDLVYDFRYALRSLSKNTKFAAVTILSLSLGIAGNTAIFTVINALLIKPLPLREPEKLVRITELYPKAISNIFSITQGPLKLPPSALVPSST